MKYNMYIQSLKMGYEKGNEGVSLNQVTKELGITFPDDASKVNYVIWFYTNFYQSDMEPRISPKGIMLRLTPNNVQDIQEKNDLKSYIKGEALNKYIDYLELERTRKSARNASWFSSISIIIAALSIILPVRFPHTFKPNNTEIKANERDYRLDKKQRDLSPSKIVVIDSVSVQQRDSIGKLKSKD